MHFWEYLLNDFLWLRSFVKDQTFYFQYTVNPKSIFYPTSVSKKSGFFHAVIFCIQLVAKSDFILKYNQPLNRI